MKWCMCKHRLVFWDSLEAVYVQTAKVLFGLVGRLSMCKFGKLIQNFLKVFYTKHQRLLLDCREALYHKLSKTFSKFYRRYYDLISKFQVGLKSLLRKGLSEPDFYGDLVYKLKRLLALIIFQCSLSK